MQGLVSLNSKFPSNKKQNTVKGSFALLGGIPSPTPPPPHPSSHSSLLPPPYSHHGNAISYKCVQVSHVKNMASLAIYSLFTPSWLLFLGLTEGEDSKGDYKDSPSCFIQDVPGHPFTMLSEQTILLRNLRTFRWLSKLLCWENSKAARRVVGILGEMSQAAGQGWA